ncbi:MAG: DNA polymerase III subunit beta [Syntrophaceticus sp.]|nr:DNA polymerase III subunit beta [Syntrophaceticus sp.]MDD3314314.1 DNA polymerase III subunit beta [Syntrophaceticus sp.]MDD4359280.1 DNA polymerase III subunit beta [Syntrophaceticus sp.]MDD4782128.1 DNA polymerase III subunit beta [Syntrophaceticus sp.]
MKIICSHSELSPTLASLYRIVPSRTNMPVLNGCLLTAEDQNLVLQCSDLELSLQITIPVQVEEEGSAVVLAKHFSELVHRLPDEKINLSWSDQNNLIELKCGSLTSNIHTWNAEEFPLAEKKSLDYKINVQAKKWKRLINKIIIAAAQQDIRANYAGVYIRFDNDQIQMVATDAYRLALIKIQNDTDVSDCDIFIPARTLTEVNRLIADGDQLEISWDKGTIYFSANNFLLTSRLINLQFPNYEKIIPVEYEMKIEVPREIMLTTLERASIFIPENEHFAVSCLQVEGDRFIIKADAAEVGSLEEIIDLREPAAHDCKAFFNVKYLLDPLQVLEQDQVTLCFNGSSGPAVYTEKGEDEYYLHLVSPVCRIS